MGGRGGDFILTRSVEEQMEAPQNEAYKVEAMQRKIKEYMPQAPSEQELEDMTPEGLLEFYKGAIISLSIMAADISYEIEGSPYTETHRLSYDVRATIPGTAPWVDKTSDGRVW